MRSSIAITFSLIGFGLFLAACSEQGSASRAADAPVKVQVSQLFLTVKNDAGVPLTNVTVSIIPAARSSVYSSSLARLENGESRDIMLGNFTGRDDTAFNLRAVGAKSVEVKGTDANGKTYDVTLPWK